MIQKFHLLKTHLDIKHSNSPQSSLFHNMANSFLWSDGWSLSWFVYYDSTYSIFTYVSSRYLLIRYPDKVSGSWNMNLFKMAHKKLRQFNSSACVVFSVASYCSLLVEIDRLITIIIILGYTTSIRFPFLQVFSSRSALLSYHPWSSWSAVSL